MQVQSEAEIKNSDWKMSRGRNVALGIIMLKEHCCYCGLWRCLIEGL